MLDEYRIDDARQCMLRRNNANDNGVWTIDDGWGQRIGIVSGLYKHAVEYALLFPDFYEEKYGYIQQTIVQNVRIAIDKRKKDLMEQQQELQAQLDDVNKLLK